jgi:hypothetical protein
MRADAASDPAADARSLSDPRRHPKGFETTLQAALGAKGVVPGKYEAWMTGFIDCKEGLRFDGSADALCLSDLRVFGPLGEGVGGTVLREVLRLADELDLTVVLNPWALRDGPEGALAQDELEAWYARLGFVWEEDVESHMMARAPLTPIPDPRGPRAPAP